MRDGLQGHFRAEFDPLGTAAFGQQRTFIKELGPVKRGCRKVLESSDSPGRLEYGTRLSSLLVNESVLLSPVCQNFLEWMDFRRSIGLSDLY